MDETKMLLIGSVKDRRRLAVAMLDGFAANAFDQPADPEDVAFFEAELAECDAQLAELLNE